MQQLPAMTYARFPLPESEAEYELLSDYIYQTWLPQAGYALAAHMGNPHRGKSVSACCAGVMIFLKGECSHAE
jgi:DNA gyrase inhibitor GyrI